MFFSRQQNRPIFSKGRVQDFESTRNGLIIRIIGAK
jgi:hypothetical protein